MKKIRSFLSSIKTALIIILVVMVGIFFILGLVAELNPVFLRRFLENFNVLWVEDVAFILGVLIIAVFSIYVTVAFIQKKRENDN